MSVQPYKKRDCLYGLEKLFFDFGSEKNREKAWLDVQKFAKSLKNFYGIKPLIVFSGKKGYLLYVWLWNTVQFHTFKEEMIKKIYSGLQNKLLKGHSEFEKRRWGPKISKLPTP